MLGHLVEKGFLENLPGAFARQCVESVDDFASDVRADYVGDVITCNTGACLLRMTF
jgi:hypothetical protein